MKKRKRKGKGKEKALNNRTHYVKQSIRVSYKGQS